MKCVFDKERFTASDDSGWDGSITFSFTDDGSMHIAAEQEHAVGSYNVEYANSYTLPPDVCRALRIWMLR
jgi:hypothetical protein